MKLLKDSYYQKLFTDSIEVELRRLPNSAESTDENSERILTVIDAAATINIPAKTQVRKENEVWRNDAEFNNIINLRQNINKTSDAYKDLTKRLKRRIKFLRNNRLKEEASEINLFATNKEIEQLYNKFKTDSSTFRTIKPSNKCEPAALKEHFSKHIERNGKNHRLNLKQRLISSSC